MAVPAPAPVEVGKDVPYDVSAEHGTGIWNIDAFINAASKYDWSVDSLDLAEASPVIDLIAAPGTEIIPGFTIDPDQSVPPTIEMSSPPEGKPELSIKNIQLTVDIANAPDAIKNDKRLKAIEAITGGKPFKGKLKINALRIGLGEGKLLIPDKGVDLEAYKEDGSFSSTYTGIFQNQIPKNINPQKSVENNLNTGIQATSRRLGQERDIRSLNFDFVPGADIQRGTIKMEIKTAPTTA